MLPVFWLCVLTLLLWSALLETDTATFGDGAIEKNSGGSNSRQVTSPASTR